MKYALILLIALFIFIGCSETAKTDKTEIKTETANDLLSEKNLPVQIFKLDINADNSLITSGGVIVQIPKGSLVSDKNPVELEIQEALSMKDIFMAGLQTKSNGEALSSGGMISINAKAGYNVSIREKLQVMVPTKNYNPDMQVYDGVNDSTGNINWVNPKPLPETKTTKRISHGEQLFMSNCASCHAVHKDATGPALYNVQNRRPKQWLYDFTRNSAASIAGYKIEQKPTKTKVKIIRFPKKSEGNEDTATLFSNIDKRQIPLAAMHDTATRYDYYSCCIYNAWNKTAMTAFPDFTDKDLDDLYTYVKLESDKRPELASKYKSNCCDSFEIYMKAVTVEQQNLSKIFVEQNKLFSLQQIVTINKNRLIAGSSNVFDNVNDTTGRRMPVSANRPSGEPMGGIFQRNTGAITASNVDVVSPELTTGVFYELDIKTFGWKNIDILIARKDGVVSSFLWARIAESTDFKIRVQLLIPSLKICLAGGRVGKDEFSFKTVDGRIDLPQGVKCIIIAISEKEEKLYFDMKEFTSSTKQTIEMRLGEESAEQVNRTLNSLNMEGLTSNVRQSEHVQELRKMEKDIERIQNSINKFDQIKDSILKRLKQLDYLKPKNCGCDDSKTRSEPAPPARVERVIMERN